ncbi:MAG TPA: hypothetical protein VJ732_17255, partial [Bryobacteraceae bacterium]|nr:hypothetical protein [Bryobacteraceae bacterium]
MLRARVSILAVIFAATLAADGPTASELYKKGRDAEKHGHMAQAYIFYSEAAAMDPSNQIYWLRSQAVRTRAALEAKPQPQPATQSMTQATADADDDADAPADDIPEATPQDLRDAQKPLPPSAMASTKGTLDFNLKEDSKKLFEDVSKAFGLDCVFDSDYQASTAPIRFRVEGVNYRDALHDLEAATGSFIIPLSDKLFLVAKDTPQKRTELEPQVAVQVRLPEVVTPQEFTSMITAVQQSM